MTGKEAYENKYERMSMRRIEASNPEWYLYGFYNSIVIKRSYKTAYEYLGYVINFLENNTHLPEEMTVDDYYKFMASIRNCSPSKQIGAYHSLQKYTKYLYSKNISEDYMKYIDRPQFFETQETINKRENGFLTKEEAKTMINSVTVKHKNEVWKCRDRAIMLIFLTTGIRCSALYKLDVNDVDLQNKVIIVKEKGNKNRKINIPDLTVNAVIKWLNYREEILGHSTNENALILSNRKRRMESESIYALIRGYGKIITGKNITPHKFRATFATNLQDETHDIYFVQQCMGHSSPKTTEIYIRGKKNEFSEKAANIMENFLE